jgi:dolichol-phosphate mannosyltransferase
MNEKMNSIGIVIPLANESKTMHALYDSICSSLSVLNYKFIIYLILDKASRDNTKSICKEISKKDERFIFVWGENNKNAIDAYLLGYSRACLDNHDAVIEMDGGLSHNPKEIFKFLALLEKDYDCVFGSRFIEGGSIDNSRASRHFLSKAGTSFSNLLLGMSYIDGTSGFIAMKRKAIIYLLDYGIKSTSHFYQTEIRYIMKNFKCIETPITYNSPSASVSLKSLINSIYLLFYYTLDRIFKSAK